MTELRFTLLADGRGDRCLLRILKWLLQQHLGNCAIQEQWADLERLRKRPNDLPGKMTRAMELFPCDILFVHRDAEGQTRESREQEIESARQQILSMQFRHICVIPVRMTEAWIMFDEAAIRRASGNPNGSILLDLPSLNTVENVPDPKDRLHRMLRTASELSGRRLRNLRLAHAAIRIVDYVDDFSPLRQLPAFQVLEEDVRRFSEGTT